MHLNAALTAGAAHGPDRASVTAIPPHPRPWGAQPDDDWLERLCGGAPLTPRPLQQAALIRLPAWLADTRELMGAAHGRGLKLSDAAPLSADQASQVRELLTLVPAELLYPRMRQLADTFRPLSARDGWRPTFDELFDLRELMAHLARLFDRVAPSGGAFEPEVLQGLAQLRRWERSPHDSLHPDVREDVAALLQEAALTPLDSAVRGSITLSGWREAAAREADTGVAPDLPDADILRLLHLPEGLVRMELRGELPYSWNALRRKAEAGGIVIER